MPKTPTQLQTLAEHGVAAVTLERAREIGSVVTDLTKDGSLASASLLHAVMQEPGAVSLPASVLKEIFGTESLRLAAELQRLGEFGLDERWSERHQLQPGQAETLRKMLLAVVGDPRLVVARLAQQLVRMRHSRELDPPERQRAALETRDLYAPLANRLGIWSVKWELEDLSFRELQADDYHRLAAVLNEKRRDRESYIERICALLAAKLAEVGIAAQIQGRSKHIYSIYRKMQRKQIPFERLFDVRAVRIIVATVADCYAALGLVHTLWPFIPGEFDDYIATPKDNDYQSIHTAVTGPDARSLEIQIRTRQMQEQAELGVAAHWLYKEGAARNQQYERKIHAVRELLDPATALAGDFESLGQAGTSLFADRIYAMTPKGEVVDLPRGGTPLDFAFHVHSDLGQRCKGAKVNGRIVPLDHHLANGDVVEIIVGKQAAPSRDWLLPSQGYLASAKSRAKLRAYFRHLDEATAPPAHATAVEAAPAVVAPLGKLRLRKLRGSGRSPVDIEGVGDLPVTLARCCAPVRPQPIAGYLTLGRGVTIHRGGCASFIRMQNAKPERGLKVEWTTGIADLLPAKISIEAFDRRGLLRDISDLIAEEHLSIEGVTSDTDPADRIARFSLRLGVHDMPELERLMKRLARIPNVYQVRRAG